MQPTKSTEMMVSDEKSTTFGRQGPSRETIIIIMILAVATIVFIVGIALIAIAAKEKGKKARERQVRRRPPQPHQTKQQNVIIQMKRNEWGLVKSSTKSSQHIINSILMKFMMIQMSPLTESKRNSSPMIQRPLRSKLVRTLP